MQRAWIRQGAIASTDQARYSQWGDLNGFQRATWAGMFCPPEHDAKLPAYRGAPHQQSAE